MEKIRAILVSSTHWDREWYWPLERFRFEMVHVMDRLLDTLESDPRFRSFTFDGQSIVIEDYLEIRPDKRAALENLVKAGRLFFGPWYVQPDEFLVSGESLIRNFERGIRTASGVGGWLPIGYTPDMFGHIPQLPQILRLFGITAGLMTRGMGPQLDGQPVQTEFVWHGLDGTKLRMLFQLRSYGNAANLGIGHVSRPGERVPPSPGKAIEEVEREAALLSPVSPTGTVLLNNGTDHTGHQPELPDLVEHVNRASQKVEVLHGSYLDYLAEVPFLPDRLPQVDGELRGARYAPLLPGVLSARVYLKQANAACESALCAYAEPLSLLAELIPSIPQSPASAPSPATSSSSGFLDHAWQLLLQNHPHDSICGCSVDSVHQENEIRFAKVLQVAHALADHAQRELGRCDQASPEGCLAVYNPGGWSIAWPAVGRIRNARALPPLAGSDGQALAMDVTLSPDFRPLDDCRIDPTVGADTVRLLHRPRHGCGLEVLSPLRATAPTGDAAPAAELVVTDSSVENRYFRLTFPRRGRSGLLLLDKASGVLFGPLCRFESVADAGDEYEFQPLPSGEPGIRRPTQKVTMVPGRSSCVLRIETRMAVPARLHRESLTRSRDKVVLTLDSEVTVFADHPVIHVRTRVCNCARDHKLYAAFRMPRQFDRLVCGTQFGSMEREVAPANVVSSIETIPPWHPFRDFLVVPGKRAGLALFARGLVEFGIPEERLLALTLWRSVEWLSRPDLPFRPGDAGPMMHTPEAQCLRDLEFEYAFASVDGDNRLADGTRVWQAAHLFANPPVVWATCPSSTPEQAAPGRFLVHVETEEVVLSSIRRLPEGNAVRATVYNASDRAVTCVLSIGIPFAAARRTDFLSQPLALTTLTRDGSMLSLPLGPFEVACLELNPV